jgi:integrase
MIRERNGVWRIRSRSKSCPIDAGLGTSDLAEARRKARELLASGAAEKVARGTFEEAAAVYLTIPKRCNDASARKNVIRLRSVVRKAFGAELEAVKLERLPELWHAYVAARQGRKAADYSRRARENLSINAAMRQAASVFRRKLLPHYRRAGVDFPADGAVVEFLPVVIVAPSSTNDAALVTAWRALEETDRDLWAAVGLARFAGLRSAEILACRGKWIEPRAGGAVVRLRDREEDGHRTKTGREYTAVILEPSLADWLLALPPEAPAISRPDAATWITKTPQRWLKPFVGNTRKPLHRLRGLYADQIKAETEAAILARAAGIRAAQEALGHTSPQTTERHYLS